MKRTTRWTALLLAGAMTLSLAACGGGGEGGDGQASTTFRELYASEATTLNYLVTSQATEFELCANFVDTLIQYDEFGVAHGGLATDWTTSEDGLTWTFTLREGVKWYRSDGSEYADLTAQDFVTGLQYVCDPANDSKTFDIVSSVVKNAQEYYSGAITDPNEIGVRAVDDMTVEYTLNAPTPYFLSMLSYVCFMPVNADFLAEVGDRFGTSAHTLLYNGAYICQEFNPQESQLWVKNPNYWNADNVYIERIERTYNTEANLIRTITPEGFVDYNGVDYTQMGDLAEISNTDPFNEELALQYKEQAVEELTAAGATFPIKILMPYNPATPYWGESCQIIEQQLESLLGTDYIDITVEAGPSTNFLAEVRKSGEYSLMLCNWGPDYADPETYSDPWSLGYTYSWPELTTQSDLLTGYIYTEEDMAAGVFDEEKFIGTPETVYIKMVQEGKDEKLDIEKRYTAFANAEAFLIKHAIVIPFHRQADNGYVVSDLSVFDRPFSPFGVSSYRYEGAHLLETPISMDEYYAQYEQWETDRQAALEAAAAES